MPGQFEWVDIWRDTTDPRWAEAHQLISKIFRRALAKHPIAKESTKREDIESWIGMFWVHLTESPQTLAARITHHQGAVYTEAWRFLDKRHGSEGKGFRQKLVRHLRSKKVIPVLREDNSFHNSFRNFWELVEKNIARKPLGVIPSILKPQNATQIPPLVQKEDLPPHLKQILLEENKVMSDWDLTDEIWKRLEPNPDGVLFLEAQSESQTEDQEAPQVSMQQTSPEDSGLKSHHKASESFEVDLPFYLSEILDTLQEEEQRIVAMLMKQQSQVQIAEELSIPRRKVQDGFNHFKSLLRDIITREELEEEEVQIIIENLVQLWRVELFSSEHGGEE